MRRTVATVTERHRPLAVDDSSEPGKVCTCGHNTYHTGALGKLPNLRVEIPTEPLRVPDHLGVDHFAAFLSEWPRRIILGGHRRGVRGVRRRTPARGGEGTGARQQLGAPKSRWRSFECWPPDHRATNVAREHATITGYACACPDTSAPPGPPSSSTLRRHRHHRRRRPRPRTARHRHRPLPTRLADWRCNDPVPLAPKSAAPTAQGRPDGHSTSGGEAA